MGYERNDRWSGGDRERNDRYGSGDGYGSRGNRYGYDRDQGARSGQTYGRQGYGDRDRDRSYYGSSDRASYDAQGRGYDRDENDRGFFERAGDEVRSWFGDEEAERRRRDDDRRAEREQGYGGDRGYRSGWSSGDYGDYSQTGYGQSGHGYDSGSSYRGGSAFGSGRDSRTDYQSRGASNSSYTARQRDHDTHYSDWRDRQIQAFDRDYDEYRQHHQARFENEFGSWRQNRQSQRDLLRQVKEHQDVVGSDGEHLGTVDHVRGDNIKLTKNDQQAGGHHHLIPSSWISSVEDNKVTVDKTAAEAKRHWTDVADKQNSGQSGGLFGSGNQDREGQSNLNRSFSGTY